MPFPSPRATTSVTSLPRCARTRPPPSHPDPTRPPVAGPELIHGNTVGHPDKNGEIVEVRGAEGEPPYLVRFDDGRTRLVFPGPDAVIVPR
jgi:hypothetical protein